MQSSQVLRFAGDVSIDKAAIINPAGFYQDIAAQVINIQFYEDLFSPFITGSLVVKESLDLVNLFPFIGEEYLELEITTPALDGPSISGKYYIYKLSDRDLVGDRQVVYQLHFISPEAIVDLNKKSSRGFSGKISELADSFLKDKSVGLETEKKTFVEETSNSTKYVSNYWTPVENLIFLQNRAANKSNVPNYVFFENRDGFFFTSLDTLYGNNVYQKFVYDKYTRDDRPLSGSIKNIDEDYRRINTITIPVGYDYMDRISNGMISSRLISYDLTTKQYSAQVYDMFKNFDKQKHLNKNSVNSQKAVWRNNAKIFNITKYHSNYTGFGDNTYTKYVQERYSLMKLAESNKLQITVPGRTDYTVGQVVEVLLNRVEPISKNESDTDDQMFSGKYIIAAINHYVDRERHECNMELIKDSSLMNMDKEQ